MLKKLKNKLKNHLKEVLEIKTSPFSIASGFAVGTLIAILPTFGFGVLIGLLVVLIFKKVSKVSLLFAFAIWNPLVQIPIYALSYYIGDIIMGDLPIKTFRFEFLSKFYIFSRRFLVGNLILSLALSIVSFVVVLYLVKFYRKTKLTLNLTHSNIKKSKRFQNAVIDSE
jgi:uncharacterized protein